MRKVNSKFMVVLFLAYIVILFRITVFRSSFSLSHFMQNGAVNLTLFQDYLPLLQQGRWSLFLYLFAGNIICFFPWDSDSWPPGKLYLCGRLRSVDSDCLLSSKQCSTYSELEYRSWTTWC